MLPALAVTLIQLGWLLQLHLGPVCPHGLVWWAQLLVTPDLPCSGGEDPREPWGVLLGEFSSLNDSMLWRNLVLMGSDFFYFFFLYVLKDVQETT